MIQAIWEMVKWIGMWNVPYPRQRPKKISRLIFSSLRMTGGKVAAGRAEKISTVSVFTAVGQRGLMKASQQSVCRCWFNGHAFTNSSQLKRSANQLQLRSCSSAILGKKVNISMLKCVHERKWMCCCTCERSGWRSVPPWWRSGCSPTGSAGP